MNEITLAATLENIDLVTDFVSELLDANGCSMRVQTQINIAIDELFSNIARYAYAPGEGDATVQVEFVENNEFVELTFIDSGTPYDPLAKADPDTTLSAEEREIGGLGIFMVKKSVDDIKYEYKNGQNVLMIKKKII